MSLSVLDLFTVGIGPSSSHTVGPMRAALRFATDLQRDGLLESVARVETGLFGSLGATGRGHGSDRAVLLGLEGADPETVDIDHAYGRVEAIREEGRLRLAGEHEIAFDVDKDLILHLRQSLPGHPNGMRFTAFDAAGQEVRMREYYSVGGGFVVDADAVESDSLVADKTRLPAPFTTGDELLEACRISGRSIAELMMANEEVFRPARRPARRSCTSGTSCRSASTTGAPAPKSSCPADCRSGDAPPRCARRCVSRRRPPRR